MPRLASCILLTAFAWTCAAHESLQHFVHHTATFTIREDAIDVAIDLVFYGEHAAAERARMDADQSGTISNAEWIAYKAAIAEVSSSQVSILSGDDSLSTVALYEPEVDMQRDWSRNDAPVTVHLVFFAPRPTDANADIWMRDTLWLDVPALCLTKVEGGGRASGLPTPMTRAPAGVPREHRGTILTPKKGEP
jgi:hypothetical protein